MEYFTEVLNRRSGDLETISIGDWITITEFGMLIGAGRKEIRTLLLEIDFLQPETNGKTKHTRMRICPWVLDMEWGKRIDRPGKLPFDVISPEAQQWLLGRIQEAKKRLAAKSSQPAKAAADDLSRFIAWRIREGMNTEQDFTTWRKFLWLADHHPHLNHEEVASILQVSRQIVSRYSKDRQQHRSSILKRMSTPLTTKKIPPQGQPWIDTILCGLDDVVPHSSGQL